jgi:hypothetical protein
MNGHDRHIPTEHLAALAFVARAPEAPSTETPDDTVALEHLAACDECATRFDQIVLDADVLRDVAFAEADSVFDDAMLDAQRTRILDRLAHLGQSARVLSFPRRGREATMPVSSTGRRWISVAAVAGLIIGLVAGQMLHFVPSAPLPLRDDGVSMQTADRQVAPTIVPASATLPALSDDELMEEVEAAVAVQLRRVRGLRVIDALTPTPTDILASGRD